MKEFEHRELVINKRRNGITENRYWGGQKMSNQTIIFHFYQIDLRACLIFKLENTMALDQKIIYR
jgi:hypothetical protein